MKWIVSRPGVYKYVADNHPDQAVPPPPNKPGVPTILTTLPWGESEAQIHASDKETSIRATDHFLKQREEWTRTSRRYRNYEADRKKEWARNKPAWRKAQKGIT